MFVKYSRTDDRFLSSVSMARDRAQAAIKAEMTLGAAGLEARATSAGRVIESAGTRVLARDDRPRKAMVCPTFFAHA